MRETRVRRTKRRLRRGLKRTGEALGGALAVALLGALRLINPDLMANFAGWLMRKIGPLLPEHRLGRANLTAAFPEKSAAEIDAILPASGTISAASAPNSPISTGCGTTMRRIRSGAAASSSRRPTSNVSSGSKPTASRR